MGNNLRICFGGENMTLAFEDFFERKIVLDDTVMDNSDLACFMGMGILIGRPSVGRPSSMTDPYPSIKGLPSDQFLQSL